MAELLCYDNSRELTDGNWTNTDTKRYALGLLIDQIDIAAGGGGGGRPEFRGGNL